MLCDHSKIYHMLYDFKKSCTIPNRQRNLKTLNVECPHWIANLIFHHSVQMLYSTFIYFTTDLNRVIYCEKTHVTQNMKFLNVGIVATNRSYCQVGSYFHNFENYSTILCRFHLVLFFVNIICSYEFAFLFLWILPNFASWRKYSFERFITPLDHNVYQTVISCGLSSYLWIIGGFSLPPMQFISTNFIRNADFWKNPCWLLI